MQVTQELLNTIAKNMDFEVRMVLNKRIEMMLRTLSFLKEQNNERLMYILQSGYQLEDIGIICCLSAFYQIILGPLASSIRSTPKSGIGGRISIQYGNLEPFNDERSNKIKETYDIFIQITESLGLPFWWLQASRTEDLIYKIHEEVKKQNE